MDTSDVLDGAEMARLATVTTASYSTAVGITKSPPASHLTSRACGSSCRQAMVDLLSFEMWQAAKCGSAGNGLFQELKTLDLSAVLSYMYAT